ncbi:hydroxyisourate hydrolase [Rhizobium sp. CC-YZS058]|uniref:hydroxyisourate hydrolase n=1 Tax=Rhizobium sp. CC-YZS058 TaxID=3042153 RepID=UPI002B05E690|nr:hydroxyisourate hydrolase [Rhizobium sp. CC-YZS058]MEA3534099.1 hydroxyisourate hydrolase [Rhizobium sp. CC-YZS058]
METKGRLTTHVLDAALGRPAEGLVIDLVRIDGEQRTPLGSVRTNEDGRVDQPLLSGETMVAGCYELLFHAGDYLKRSSAHLTDPPFLDLIPLRFTIADAGAHYHVPLLLSPFSYSTYRGS